MPTKIIRGEDRNLNFTLSVQDGRFLRAYDLSTATKIQAIFKTYVGDKLIIDDVPAHGREAEAIYEEVTFTADNIGDAGNSIVLNFDGSKTITQALNEWNAGNPSNTVSSDVEDPSVVLPAKTVQLSGGRDDFPKIAITDAVKGKITVKLENDDTNALNIGTNQSVGFIIDFGEHDLGDRRKAVARNAIDVLSESF